MASNAELALEIFKANEGLEDGSGDWLTIDQARINSFADATLDHQFIHIDPEKSAKLSPFKTTIAHGFLTLSLVTHLSQTVKSKIPEAFNNLALMVNYGLDKVRFTAPVLVNSKIRAHRQLLAAELKDPKTIQLKQKITVEIEGQEKPACVAEVVFRLIYM